MKKYLLAFAMTAFTSSAAWAGGLTDGLGLGSGHNTGKLYVGASLGALQGSAKDTCDELDLDCKTWKVYGGYKVHKNVAIEGGYYNLFDATKGDYKMSLTGVALNAVVSTRAFDKAEVFGKVGLFSGKAEAVVDLGKYASNTTTETNNNNVLLGVGASYQLTDNLGLRGEYEMIQNKDKEIGKVGILTGGVTFSTM